MVTQYNEFLHRIPMKVIMLFMYFLIFIGTMQRSLNYYKEKYISFELNRNLFVKPVKYNEVTQVFFIFKE